MAIFFRFLSSFQAVIISKRSQMRYIAGVLGIFQMPLGLFTPWCVTKVNYLESVCLHSVVNVIHHSIPITTTLYP